MMHKLVAICVILAASLLPIGVGAASTPIQVSVKSVTLAVSQSPGVSNGTIYGAGDVVGTILTFANMFGAPANSGIIESINFNFKDKQTVPFDLCLFTTLPTGTYTDNTAPAPSAADKIPPYLIGCYTLSIADSSLGAVTVYNLDGIGKATKSTSTSLWGVVTTPGTPTLTSASDMTVTVAVLEDN